MKNVIFGEENKTRFLNLVFYVIIKVLYFNIYSMSDKKEKFSFKKLFFMKSFFGSLVGKIEISDKPLNWLSIVFLIAFDIFIFTNLLDWLESQSRNIEAPYEKYSYECKELFTLNNVVNWETKFSLINRDNYWYLRKNINAPFYDENFKKDNKADLCKTLLNKTAEIKNNPDFISLYNKLENIQNILSRLENEKYNYEYDYEEFREDYKAWLWAYNDRLTDIKNDRIRSDYNKILAEISLRQTEKKKIISELNNLSEIKDLNKYINENKEQFISEEENYRFWYPVYVTLMESILIFPILIFTVLLYNFAIKRRLRILSILASNLALISGLFAFFILIKVIYWILPHKFFANVITYLASIKALAIWNYVLTIFGILLFGLLMYSSQKWFEKYKKIKEEQAKQRELLNKERIGKERYWKKTCIDCNTKLLDWASHCSNCWADQYKECSKCKNRMPRAYSHCEKCGTKN